MRLFAVAIISGLLASTAQAQPVWSIWWQSDPVGCDMWGDPMTAKETSFCRPASFCAGHPMFQAVGPYEAGKPITVIGWQLVQVLTDPTASGYMALGSLHDDDGADIFAITGGVGTNQASGRFPAGLGIPQGGVDAHFDVYGHCDKGEQQALVKILYTSP